MIRVGIIYKATSPSGKSYVGQTIKTLIRRRGRHYFSASNKNSSAYNSAISRAIRKYGDNINWSIIYDNIPIMQLDNMERWCISNYGTYRSGYNATLGGKGSAGCFPSEATRRKIFEAGKGRVCSKKTRLKLSRLLKGRKFSDEHKRKLSNAKSGSNNYTYGKHLSATTRAKMAKAQRGEKGHNAKLTMNSARKIRTKYATKNYTQTKLAKEYGVSRETIRLVVNNLRWT